MSRAIPQAVVQDWLIRAGWLGPGVFIGLAFLTFLAAPVSATPLLAVGFYLFGRQVVIYLFIAATISSVTNFWIARLWGRGIVIKLVGQKNIHTVDALIEQYGFGLLIILRLFEGGIYDFVSYGAGLTTMKFWPYFFISLFMSLPGAFMLFFLATQTNDPVVLVGLNLVVCVLLSGIVLLARQLKRISH